VFLQNYNYIKKLHYFAETSNFFFVSGSGHHFFAMLYQIILTIKAIAIGSSVFFQKAFVNSMSKFKAAQ
jgi:hypothetical protein